MVEQKQSTTLQSVVKKVDLHGQKAELSLTYKSVCGGITTILLMLAILSYGAYEIQKQATEPFTYDFKYYEGPASETNAFIFREQDFTAAITLQSKDQTKSFDLEEKFGRFQIRDQTGAGYPTKKCYEDDSTDQVSQNRLLQEQERSSLVNGEDTPALGRSLKKSGNQEDPLLTNFSVLSDNYENGVIFELKFKIPNNDRKLSYRTYHISTQGQQLYCKDQQPQQQPEELSVVLQPEEQPVLKLPSGKKNKQKDQLQYTCAIHLTPEQITQLQQWSINDIQVITNSFYLDGSIKSDQGSNKIKYFWQGPDNQEYLKTSQSLTNSTHIYLNWETPDSQYAAPVQLTLIDWKDTEKSTAIISPNQRNSLLAQRGFVTEMTFSKLPYRTENSLWNVNQQVPIITGQEYTFNIVSILNSSDDPNFPPKVQSQLTVRALSPEADLRVLKVEIHKKGKKSLVLVWEEPQPFRNHKVFIQGKKVPCYRIKQNSQPSCWIKASKLLDKPINLTQGETLNIRIEATSSNNETKVNYAQGYFDLTPGTPQNFRVRPVENYFQLDWATPKDFAEVEILYYQIYWRMDQQQTWRLIDQNCPENNCKIRDIQTNGKTYPLESLKTYYFKVVAFNQFGGGQYDREESRAVRLGTSNNLYSIEMDQKREKLILDESQRLNTISVKGKQIYCSVNSQNSCELDIDELTSSPISMNFGETLVLDIQNDSFNKNIAQLLFEYPPSSRVHINYDDSSSNRAIRFRFNDWNYIQNVTGVYITWTVKTQRFNLQGEFYLDLEMYKGQKIFYIPLESLKQEIPIINNANYTLSTRANNYVGLSDKSHECTFNFTNMKAPQDVTLDLDTEQDKIKVSWKYPNWGDIQEVDDYQEQVFIRLADKKRFSKVDCNFENGTDKICSIDQQILNKKPFDLRRGQIVKAYVNATFNGQSRISEIGEFVQQTLVRDQPKKEQKELIDTFEQINRFYLNPLEAKMSQTENQATDYEKYQNELRFSKLKNQSFEFQQSSSFKKFLSGSIGGTCPAQMIEPRSVRQKCSFDFKYVPTLFKDGHVDKLYDSVEDCMEQNVNQLKPSLVTKQDDLMIETNPIDFNKKFIEYSFYPCKPSFESSINSGVVCEYTQTTIDKILEMNSVFGMWWFEHLVIPNPDLKDLPTPFDPMEGEQTYILYPQRDMAQSEQPDINLQQIITLVYQKNVFKTVTRNGLVQEQSFGQLRFSRSEYRQRDDKIDPLVTFRIEFDLNEKITTVTEKGLDLFDIVIATLGIMGGLFNPFQFVSMFIVSFLVKPGYTEFMTNNLFLVSKNQSDQGNSGDNEDDVKLREDSNAKEQPNVRNHKYYGLLKKNIEDRKTYQKEDVENIVNEMIDKRQTVSQLASESSYKWYFYSQQLKINCCKKKSRGFQYKLGRVQQASRKLKKVQNILHVLHSVNRSNILADTLMTKPQKLLSRFQRYSLIEAEDCTESSEVLDDYFKDKKLSQDEIKEKFKIILNRFKPQKLRPIDEVLLKGVYTNDKKELNEEPLILKSLQNIDEFKKKMSTFAKRDQRDTAQGEEVVLANQDAHKKKEELYEIPQEMFQRANQATHQKKEELYEISQERDKGANNVTHQKKEEPFEISQKMSNRASNSQLWDSLAYQKAVFQSLDEEPPNIQPQQEIFQTKTQYEQRFTIDTQMKMLSQKSNVHSSEEISQFEENATDQATDRKMILMTAIDQNDIQLKVKEQQSEKTKIQT